MFVDFFESLRDVGVPVTLREYLGFLEALEKRVIPPEANAFYFLARTALVKDERFFDPFDKAFAHFFKGAEKFFVLGMDEIPPEWLNGPLKRIFSAEEMEKIMDKGGWQALLAAMKKLREEQEGRHEGGNRYIGTGGTSPYGQGGQARDGVKVGDEDAEERKKRGIRAWEKREYKHLAKDVTINTRNIKLALRRLRRFTREGVPDELDIARTIRETARNGSMFDVEMRPSRKNRVKVLLLFDIGGSMTPHVKRCEQLFYSSRSEFKNLETFYFHNCIYENLWQDGNRWGDKTKTYEILHKYNSDYRVIIVGDASMSPYEILQVGGSVDHFNDEPGMSWMLRLKESFPHLVWLNPEPQDQWEYVESINMIRGLFDNRMFPLTLNGLGDAMTLLKRSAHSPTLVPR